MRKLNSILIIILSVLIFAPPAWAGGLLPLWPTSADGIYYDNSTSGMTADTTREALDELAASIAAQASTAGVDNTAYDATSWDGVTTLAPSKNAVRDKIEGLSVLYQAISATLADIADGTIAANLVNTTNPWADNEVADTLTIGASSTVANGALDSDLQIWAGITPTAQWQSLLANNLTVFKTSAGLTIGTNVQAYDIDHNSLAAGISGIVKGGGNGSGYSAAAAGTDFVAPNGSGAALTGITASQVGAAEAVHNHAGSAINSGTVSASYLPSNSSSGAGIVASGSGQNAKVWKTDASGVPGWRDDSGGEGTDTLGALTATATSGGVVYFNGTAWVNLGKGSAGQYLKTMGAAGTVPSWGTPTGSGDMLASVYDTDANNIVDNASTLLTKTWAAPAAIGSGTPAAGAFTTLGATGTTTLASTLTGMLGASSGVVSVLTDIPTANTIGGAYVYRAAGTDVPVTDGGTGLSSGTSGGIPYFSGTTAITSSAALTASQLIVGGGAGAAPATLAAGSQYAVLRMGAATPAYGSIDLSQSAAVTGLLAGTNGGTGVNNSTRTLTYGGNVTFSGAYNMQFTVPGAYTYTLPSATSTLMATTGSPAAMVIASQATGDLLYASSASAWARLADVAAGQPLLSGGVTTAPAYAGYTFSGTAAQTYTFPSATATLYGTNTGGITSAQLATSLTNETGSGVAVFGTSPTFTTDITTPKIISGSTLTIDAVNAAADSTVAIGNSNGTYDANVTIDGDLSVAGTITSTATGDSYVSLANNAAAFTYPTYGFYFLKQVPQASVSGNTYALVTNPMTTVGDIILGSTVTDGVAAPSRLAIGTNGYVLTSNGTTASWTAVSGTGDVSGGSTSVSNEMAVYNGTGGKTLQRSLFILAGPASTAKTYTYPNADTNIAGLNYAATWTAKQTFTADDLLLAGGIQFDSTPDASGEIGYASNHFNLYANSEDMVWTAGTNMWTFSSNTGAALTVTPATTITGLLTANGGVTTTNITYTGTLSKAASADPEWSLSDLSTGTFHGKLDSTSHAFRMIENSATVATWNSAGVVITPATTVTGILTASTAINLTGANASPATTAGQIRYDSTITGVTNGALAWYDGASVRQIVDLDTTPSNDDYVVAYDADADKFYMKADATGAGGFIASVSEDTSPDLGGNLGIGSYNITGTGYLAFGAEPADSGQIRFSNNTALAWELAATGTDVFIALDGSDILQVGQNAANIYLGTSGTGNVQVAGDLTVVGSDISVGAAGVKLTGDGDGAITFLGLGNGSDEDLTLNLDDTSNTGVFSSSTGLNILDFGAIALYTTGGISGKVVVTAYTSTGNIAAEPDCYGGIVTNTGAGGAIVLTLPDAVKGMSLKVILTVAQDVDINPQNGEQILVKTNAAGDALSSDATIGSAVTLIAVSDTQWMATTEGTWTDAN
jgi:hypothetical protein